MGLSPAYLFGGDALMYSSGGYEKDASLRRRWSLYGEAGGTADLAHWGRYALQVGPVLGYDFFNLQPGLPLKDHLSYLGLRLGLVLPGKNNTTGHDKH
jgi:hypothetical protein